LPENSAREKGGPQIPSCHPATRPALQKRARRFDDGGVHGVLADRMIGKWIRWRENLITRLCAVNIS